MEENIDYLNLVTEHIEKDKILGTSNPKYHKKIISLLEKRNNIRKENGFWAESKIYKINKKIEKLRTKK